jgi:SNF2 family DNA or RNA helicase
MGLGKTIQVLALLQAAKDEAATNKTAEDKTATGSAAAPRTSIVVCPASLVLNWAEEALRFAPQLKVAPLICATRERHALIEKYEHYDLLVTSYHQLQRDIANYKDKQFRFAVLDEAQMIKNQNTHNAKAVKLLEANTCLALTGTPVENSLAELWSIFDFLMPGYLRNYNQFKKKYEMPVTKNHDELATERLRSLVRPFILRRLKGDVLKELPEKIETVLRVTFEPEQEKLYRATLAQAKKELAAKLAEATGGQGQIAILAALTRMRQICCNPALVYADYKGGSAKSDAAMELIENSIEGGHRMLLFSQFTSMLDLLEDQLDARGIRYLRLDGSTPKIARQSLVTEFNSGDAPLFLISLKAGGTGLNLTGADVVIHYDPWWNLSVQNQATDRAHRIGQEKRVQVFKLIASSTIEERILKLQEQKAELAETVIKEGGNAFESLKADDLLALFAD